MGKSQARYKSDYDRRVLETSSFQVGNYVFVDKPPLTTKSEESPDALAYRTYNKLQRRAADPCRILKVRANTVTIDERGSPNTVPFDHITHEPQPHRANCRINIPHDASNRNSTSHKAKAHTKHTDAQCRTG